MMQEKFGFNPRKCNSASGLSGCVQRNKSKAIIALPTCNNHVEIFEKSLAGGFSCVNARLAFDTKILMSNDFSKSTKHGYKRDDLKVIYNLKLNFGEKKEKR